MAGYAASKAFVLSFTEAAWAETRACKGITVLAVCPAGTDTNFQRAGNVKRPSGDTLLSPAHVAAAIRKAARRGERMTIFVGRRTLAMSLLARIAPRRHLVTAWARMMTKLR
jgi:short-subunit dehydrogenase